VSLSLSLDPMKSLESLESLPSAPNDELLAWLRLALTAGVGYETAHMLLARFGLASRIFEQSASTLSAFLRPAQVQAVLQEPPTLKATWERTCRWLQTQTQTQTQTKTPSSPAHRWVVTIGDTAYPPALLHIDRPPLMLYGMGVCGPEGLQQLCSVAVVGTRHPTAQGAVNAHQFSQTLAQAGWTVVSGLALGMDAQAHEGALAAAASADCASAPSHQPSPLSQPSQRVWTVAVVGTGLDRVYPAQHHELAQRIARNGLLLSEFPLGTPPLSRHFPQRNRLIAGLSRGTVVVEATLRSGSLITARLANEQGKEVFALPGSVHEERAKGCHALIKQGAQLVENAQDVLDALCWGSSDTLNLGLISGSGSGAIRVRGSTSFTAASKNEDKNEDKNEYQIEDDNHRPLVYRHLTDVPQGLDALQVATGQDTSRLQADLLELELAGCVARLPGSLFIRLVRG
jgi:DNA processing protein